MAQTFSHGDTQVYTAISIATTTTTIVKVYMEHLRQKQENKENRAVPNLHSEDYTLIIKAI